MRWFILSGLLALAVTGEAKAARYFAAVTAADPVNNTIVYTIRVGKDRNTVVNARVARDCVIKEGYYRLGKPARTVEGDDIAGGLKSPVFTKASVEKPVRVNIYTADEDDPGRGVRRGDVVKILVNPERKKR
jgi:hypothetical protein